MCQPLKERGDEREKKSGEQSRDVKERWGGETEDDGAKIRWGTGTGRANLVLSPRTKFPLKLLSNLAWGGGENWSPDGKAMEGGGSLLTCSTPRCSERFSLAPRRASPAAHKHYFTPPALSIAFSLGHATQCLFVKSTSCVYESPPCLTVSNQFLQVIPNYMPLVTDHKKLMKPLPSIKCNFCVLRDKRGRQKTKSSNFPLAAACLWGMASPSCPRFEGFAAEGTTLCMK